MAEPQDLLTQLFDAENKKAQLAQQLGLSPDASEEDIAQQRSQIEQELQMNDLKRQALTQQAPAELRVPSPSGQGDYIARILNEEASQREASAVERESQLQNALKNYSPTMDLSGLAIGMDTVYGTNVAQALKPGANKDADLIDQLLKEKRAEPKKTTSSALVAQQSKQTGIQERFDTSQQNIFQKEIQGDLEKDIVEPLNIRLQQFSTIQSALDTDDYLTIGMTMSQFARGVAGEKGVLTDNDVARVFPNTAMNSITKLQAYLTGGGTVDPEVKAKLKTLLEITKQNSAKVYADYAKGKKENYSKRNLSKRYGVFNKGGYGDEVFKNADSVIKSFGPQEQKPAPPGPTGPGGAMSFEEFKASKKK